MAELFEELPEPSLLVGTCNIWGNDNKIKYVNQPKKLHVTDLLSLTSPFPLNPSAYFYHKTLHQKIGLYKVDEHYMMDIDFILKAVQVAKVKYINEVLGNHRQIEGTKTITLMKSGQHFSHLCRLLEEHRRTLPLFQRFTIFTKFNYDKYCKKVIYFSLKLKHFSSNPKKLLSRLRAKLINFFN